MLDFIHHLGMQRFQHLRHGTPISSSVLGDQLVGAASLTQCLLVWWSSSVEDGLAGGELGEPVVDPFGKALMMLGGWSVVTVPVDVL